MFDDNNGEKALHSMNITRVSLDRWHSGDRWIRYSRDRERCVAGAVAVATLRHPKA